VDGQANFPGAVLEALPIPVFLVDEDMRIATCNPAAAAYLASTEAAIGHRRGGEVLHCLHSANGCGRGAGCGDCVIRQVVGAVFHGHRTTRQKADLQLLHDGRMRDVQLWLTATPFYQQGRQWALVVLEDVTELMTLRGLLPICANCKKVRDSQQYWHEVTAYLHEHLNLAFTHGLCPECSREILREIPCGPA
jgi:nitrogen fixation/metabolism regulation signal transduction histidine kinase